MIENNEYKMAELISISNIPTEIDLSDIKIEKGMCFLNSYRVANKYSSVEIVEGLILIIDYAHRAKAMQHVWNKINNIHFDVTRENIWLGREEMDETKKIKYFSVVYHSHNKFKDGDRFEFCLDTNMNVKEINEVVNKK